MPDTTAVRRTVRCGFQARSCSSAETTFGSISTVSVPIRTAIRVVGVPVNGDGGSVPKPMPNRRRRRSRTLSSSAPAHVRPLRAERHPAHRLLNQPRGSHGPRGPRAPTCPHLSLRSGNADGKSARWPGGCPARERTARVWSGEEWCQLMPRLRARPKAPIWAICGFPGGCGLAGICDTCGFSRG
jgi:hypothetical protein